MSLESMRAEGAVEPTKSENNTVTWRGSAAVSLAGAATVVDVSRGARAKSLPYDNCVTPAAMADGWSRPNLSGLPPSPPAYTELAGVGPSTSDQTHEENSSNRLRAQQG